jgi:lipoprotein Spr
MKKILLILSLIGFVLISQVIVTSPLEAKSKHKHYSKSTKKGKSKGKKAKFKAKKQTLGESLQKLEQYFPAFNLETKQFDKNLVAKIGLEENTIFQNEENRVKLLENINDWLETPYRRAGRSKKGIDCSNFTSVMVNNALGIKFPSSPAAQTQAKNVELIKDIDNLQFGDLIFFSGRNKKSNRIGHVGFYLGNGLFAHSSSGRGVIYTHISENYYTPRFRYGGRILSTDNMSLQAHNKVSDDDKQDDVELDNNNNE